MKRLLTFIFKISGLLFITANLLAMIHAYKFTHYDRRTAERICQPEDLSFQQQIKILLSGISLPRPSIKEMPKRNFKNVLIDNRVACWRIDVKNSKGMVLLFHGYGSCKSSILGKAEEFNQMGYSTLLVDFQGSGGSIGSTTTIGYDEAKDVKRCYQYVMNEHPEKLFLCGTSMGAVAIMKCVAEENIQPDAIILECPFGSMLQTVSNRFKSMGLPCFPFAQLLVFYGGIINHFWAFNLNPIEYAKKINIPTLLLCGAKDERVTSFEIDAIFENLAGIKQKVIYKNAKHESYLNEHRNQWRNDVSLFLKQH